MSDAWDIASVLLKTLTAAAAITGVALPVLDAVDIKLVVLSRGHLVTTAVAFVATAVVLGLVDYTISKRKERPTGTSPGIKRRSCGNCAPRRALRGSGPRLAAGTKPATCSRLFMAGSPRVLAPPISRKQRRCSTS